MPDDEKHRAGVEKVEGVVGEGGGEKVGGEGIGGNGGGGGGGVGKGEEGRRWREVEVDSAGGMGGAVGVVVEANLWRRKRQQPFLTTRFGPQRFAAYDADDGAPQCWTAATGDQSQATVGAARRALEVMDVVDVVEVELVTAA
ncbi:hypothetical protein CYMTET_7199 [Cymbomonas tetramitiformis]|uniref:Uncharacterized protein n=1 Tax=Cymbomonas tetramitiformis TaxID=36881 RepID=A0AAE0GXF1_9CHLO|nr:hypothetical protein CYMTET_7199 [Cymbomonas tetramitiformis]